MMYSYILASIIYKAAYLYEVGVHTSNTYVPGTVPYLSTLRALIIFW